MSTIVITGVGGLLGRRLVTALDHEEDVERIVGLDLQVPRGLRSPKLELHTADVRDADLREVFGGADVVVHLAYRGDPSPDEAALRAVNVDGTRRVFEAALAAGVGHVVYPSSVLVYGAYPDNAVPLTEDSPRRGMPGLNVVEHQREVEDWLWPWLEAHALDVAVLRLATVVGPGIDNAVTRGFEAPRIPVVAGHRPPWQFLHPDDAVGALVHAVRQRLTGPYNVTAEGWLSTDEATAVLGRGVVEVPEEVAYAAAARLWALGVGEQPPGLVALLVHPCVASPARFVATGWRPQHSNRDALAAMAREHAPFVSLLGRRTTWSALRRGAASVLGLVAFGVVRRVRRTSRRRATSDQVGSRGAHPGSSPRD